MVRITIYIGHRNLKESVFNYKLLKGVLSDENYNDLITKGDTSFRCDDNHIRFRYLDQLYSETNGMVFPEMKEQIETEQNIIGKETDVIVFMFPIIWYSMPGNLKCLLDNAFTEGFAYRGCNPAFLKDKGFTCAFTYGVPSRIMIGEDNGITLDEITIPFSSFAKFTGMQFIKSFSVFTGDFCANCETKECEKKLPASKTAGDDEKMEKEIADFKKWLCEVIPSSLQKKTVE